MPDRPGYVDGVHYTEHFERIKGLNAPSVCPKPSRCC